MINMFKVGAYIRLSKEDMEKQQENESESVKNQRELINKYLQENNLILENEYIDDGYSGTTFNRPGFKKLISDIEIGKINVVITKDLSRLGRDYIKTGYYVEDYFPIKKVRYISILDGIDTYENNLSNDIAPFKALFNDMVSKDTSKKIKSILKNKKLQGLFVSSKAPYGYKKDKHNKHKLLIDEEKSEVVKKIFNLSIEGKSNTCIANYLNQKKILSPNNKKWSQSSVYNILNNKEYTGCIISNVWTNISYKNKKRIKRPENEWIVINDTHDAIIDINLFEQIHSKKNIRKNSLNKTKLLLDGLVFCYECGSRLSASYLKNRKYYILNCNKYKKNSKLCSSHYVNYNKLERMIINRLIKVLEENNYNLKEKINNRFLSFFINNITISRNKEIIVNYNFKKNITNN